MAVLSVVGQPHKIRGLTYMCGREMGTDSAFAKASHDVGELCALNGIVGYFGGSQDGNMGMFGAGVIGHGGKLIGVMPEFLQVKEKPFPNIKIEWVKDIPERLRWFKNRELVDVIVTGPCGIGGDAEHADFATDDKHDQLHLPNILLNINGVFDYRILDLRHRYKSGLLWDGPAKRLFVATKVEEILPMTRAFYAGEPVQNIFDVNVIAASAAA